MIKCAFTSGGQGCNNDATNGIFCDDHEPQGFVGDPRFKLNEPIQQQEKPVPPCSHRGIRYRETDFILFKRRVGSCKCGLQTTIYYIQRARIGVKR